MVKTSDFNLCNTGLMSSFFADRQSFLNTSKWIDEVNTQRGGDVLIFLVGNKTDLVDKRFASVNPVIKIISVYYSISIDNVSRYKLKKQVSIFCMESTTSLLKLYSPDVTRKVSTDEGEAKAHEHGAMFIETSAKAGFNIKVPTPEYKYFFFSLTFTSRSPALLIVGCSRNTWILQPLFRKIAGSLPGMDALSSAKQEDMVDINLRPSTRSSASCAASLAEHKSGGCSF